MTWVGLFSFVCVVRVGDKKKTSGRQRPSLILSRPWRIEDLRSYQFSSSSGLTLSVRSSRQHIMISISQTPQNLEAGISEQLNLRGHHDRMDMRFSNI